jgi:magnesium chelatase accessory protein
MAGWLFPMMAKLLSMNPFVPLLFSRMAASEKRIGELLASTGSRLDAEGVALYHRLASDRGHVDGTLAMMAQWDVEMLAERLPFIDTPCLFLVGEDDGTVPPRVAREAAARMPRAEVGAGRTAATSSTRRRRRRWPRRSRPSSVASETAKNDVPAGTC